MYDRSIKDRDLIESKTDIAQGAMVFNATNPRTSIALA